jgi:hypothetical protein
LTLLLASVILRGLPLAVSGLVLAGKGGVIAIVPGDKRAHLLSQLRHVALCLAVLLALTPLGQLLPTAALQAAAALAAGAYASYGDAAGGEEPALAAPADQPNAGILPRLPHLEGALLAAAEKAVLPRRSASMDPLPPEKTAAQRAAGGGFHRSSVGTARNPTGPPA